MFKAIYNAAMHWLGFADIPTIHDLLDGKNAATMAEAYKYAVNCACMMSFTEDSQAFDFKNQAPRLRSPLYIKKLLIDQERWESSLNDIAEYFTSLSLDMREPGGTMFVAFCDAFAEAESRYTEGDGVKFLIQHAHYEEADSLVSVSRFLSGQVMISDELFGTSPTFENITIA